MGARGEFDESGVVSPFGCSSPLGTLVMLGSIPGKPAEGEPDGRTPGDILFIMVGGGRAIMPFDTFGELCPEFSSSSSLNRTVRTHSSNNRHSQLAIQITFYITC